MIIGNQPTYTSFTSDWYTEQQLSSLRRQREAERKYKPKPLSEAEKAQIEARRLEIEAKERERRRIEAERQKALEEERRRIEAEKLKKEIDKLNESIDTGLKYQGLSDPVCDNMAALMLDFTCSILLGSEHNLNEFFGTEEEAETLRGELSPECQETSKTIRKELMELKITQDPVFGLITVNRLKDYLPEEDVLSEDDYNNIANSAKSGCVKLIKNSDYESFDDDEKFAMKELISIIENSDGLDFGDDYNKKLSALIERVNTKQTPVLNKSPHTKTFIPPVKVKYGQQNKIKNKDKEIY